jgi:hypothetical protein
MLEFILRCSSGRTTRGILRRVRLVDAEAQNLL